jgi:hypothetical protein
MLSLLVESGPGTDALTCEETKFSETPTARKSHLIWPVAP